MRSSIVVLGAIVIASCGQPPGARSGNAARPVANAPAEGQRTETPRTPETAAPASRPPGADGTAPPQPSTPPRPAIELGPQGAERKRLEKQTREGLAYLLGLGRPKNHARGMRLLYASCLENEFMACIHLKKYVPLAAKALLRKVTGLCASGFSRGCDSAYYLAGDVWQGIALAERGCRLGHQGACGTIAAMAAGGIKSPLGTADSLYTRACKNGHALSCYQFAHHIEDKQPARAMRLLSRACDLGETSNCERVVPAGCLAAKLSPASPNTPGPPPHGGRVLRLHRTDFGLRLVSGTRCVPPPPEVLVAMRASGATDFRVDLEVCVGTQGGVISAQLKRASGHPNWDQAALAATKTWRFRPYLTKQGSIPMCSTVVLFHEVK